MATPARWTKNAGNPAIQQAKFHFIESETIVIYS
jgi:hypothetical protein